MYHDMRNIDRLQPRAGTPAFTTAESCAWMAFLKLLSRAVGLLRWTVLLGAAHSVIYGVDEGTDVPAFICPFFGAVRVLERA